MMEIKLTYTRPDAVKGLITAERPSLKQVARNAERAMTKSVFQKGKKQLVTSAKSMPWALSMSSFDNSFDNTVFSLTDPYPGTGAATLDEKDSFLQAYFAHEVAVSAITVAWLRCDAPQDRINGSLLQFSVHGTAWVTVCILENIKPNNLLTTVELSRPVVARHWRLFRPHGGLASSAFIFNRNDQDDDENLGASQTIGHLLPEVEPLDALKVKFVMDDNSTSVQMITGYESEYNEDLSGPQFKSVAMFDARLPSESRWAAASTVLKRLKHPAKIQLATPDVTDGGKRDVFCTNFQPLHSHNTQSLQPHTPSDDQLSDLPDLSPQSAASGGKPRTPSLRRLASRSPKNSLTGQAHEGTSPGVTNSPVDPDQPPPTPSIKRSASFKKVASMTKMIGKFQRSGTSSEASPMVSPFTRSASGFRRPVGEGDVKLVSDPVTKLHNKNIDWLADIEGNPFIEETVSELCDLAEELCDFASDMGTKSVALFGSVDVEHDTTIYERQLKLVKEKKSKYFAQHQQILEAKEAAEKATAELNALLKQAKRVAGKKDSFFQSKLKRQAISCLEQLNTVTERSEAIMKDFNALRTRYNEGKFSFQLKELDILSETHAASLEALRAWRRDMEDRVAQKRQLQGALLGDAVSSMEEHHAIAFSGPDAVPLGPGSRNAIVGIAGSYGAEAAARLHRRRPRSSAERVPVADRIPIRIRVQDAAKTCERYYFRPTTREMVKRPRSVSPSYLSRKPIPPRPRMHEISVDKKDGRVVSPTNRLRTRSMPSPPSSPCSPQTDALEYHSDTQAVLATARHEDAPLESRDGETGAREKDGCAGSVITSSMGSFDVGQSASTLLVGGEDSNCDTVLPSAGGSGPRGDNAPEASRAHDGGTHGEEGGTGAESGEDVCERSLSVSRDLIDLRPTAEGVRGSDSENQKTDQDFVSRMIHLDSDEDSDYGALVSIPIVRVTNRPQSAIPSRSTPAVQGRLRPGTATQVRMLQIDKSPTSPENSFVALMDERKKAEGRPKSASTSKQKKHYQQRPMSANGPRKRSNKIEDLHYQPPKEKALWHDWREASRKVVPHRRVKVLCTPSVQQFPPPAAAAAAVVATSASTSCAQQPSLSTSAIARSSVTDNARARSLSLTVTSVQQPASDQPAERSLKKYEFAKIVKDRIDLNSSLEQQEQERRKRAERLLQPIRHVRRGEEEEEQELPDDTEKKKSRILKLLKSQQEAQERIRLAKGVMRKMDALQTRVHMSASTLLASEQRAACPSLASKGWGRGLDVRSSRDDS